MPFGCALNSFRCVFSRAPRPPSTSSGSALCELHEEDAIGQIGLKRNFSDLSDL